MNTIVFGQRELGIQVCAQVGLVRQFLHQEGVHHLLVLLALLRNHN